MSSSSPRVTDASTLEGACLLAEPRLAFNMALALTFVSISGEAINRPL